MARTDEMLHKLGVFCPDQADVPGVILLSIPEACFPFVLRAEPGAAYLIEKYQLKRI